MWQPLSGVSLIVAINVGCAQLYQFRMCRNCSIQYIRLTFQSEMMKAYPVMISWSEPQQSAWSPNPRGGRGAGECMKVARTWGEEGEKVLEAWQDIYCVFCYSCREGMFIFFHLSSHPSRENDGEKNREGKEWSKWMTEIKERRYWRKDMKGKEEGR